jgi:protein-disulfide isomerase
MKRIRTRTGIQRWAPWAAGTVVLVAAALALSFATGAPAKVLSRAQPPVAGDIAFGPRDASVVLIEYSDFECRFCAGYSEILAPLRERYANQVLFVFRFDPLDNHPYGMVSAQAAYAAYLQGKFWEMHDLLFQNQDDWSGASDPTLHFEAYASVLGLDLDKFRKDYQAESTRAFITSQKQEGTSAGVEHTPWFIVNDFVVVPRNIQEFETLFQEAAR